MMHEVESELTMTRPLPQILTMRFLAIALGSIVLATGLAAHPMGNFSVSHYTRIEVGARAADVNYVLDLAEIPTFEMLRDWKMDAKTPQSALDARAAEQAQLWMRSLEFRTRGLDPKNHGGATTLVPKFVSASVRLTDGAGGLPVARIAATLRLENLHGSLEFEDHNFPERAGWKEIVIRSGGDARIETASQPDLDRSQALTVYPADPTSAPPQDLRAAVEWKDVSAAGTTLAAERATPAPAVTRSSALQETNPLETNPPTKIVPIDQPKPLATQVAAPPPSSTPSVQQPAGTVVKGDFLSRLLGKKELGLGLTLLGILAAFGLGAIHALSPGHGKTIVAAYLVGSRGTAKHAAFLGAMVTFTHTISVFLLGLGTLLLAQYVVPEKIIPVLGAVSGLSIVAIGASLFYKRLRRLMAGGAGHAHSHAHHDHGHVHDHSHEHHHDHDHDHDHEHDHDHAHHEHVHAAAAHVHDVSPMVALHVGHDHGPAQNGHSHNGHSHDGHAHEHSHAIGGHSHDHGHAHDRGHTHDHGEIHGHTPNSGANSHDHGPHEHSHKHAGDHVHAPVNGHKHDHHHDHDVHHDHDHGPHGHSHVPEGDITLGSLVALGASGGLVPCPSALVLLLSAIALGHIGLGLILLVAFSLGLAGVLMGIGMIVVYAKHFLPDANRTSRHPAFRLIPVLSAFVIVCLGVIMTGVSLGWVKTGGFLG